MSTKGSTILISLQNKPCAEVQDTLLKHMQVLACDGLSHFANVAFLQQQGRATMLLQVLLKAALYAQEASCVMLHSTRATPRPCILGHSSPIGQRNEKNGVSLHDALLESATLAFDCQG